MEGGIIAAIACAIGCVLAYFGLKAILTVLPAAWFSLDRPIQLDRSVLFFSLVMILVTTVLTSLAPAVHSFSRNLHMGIAAADKGLGDQRHGRLRSALVIAEITLSVVLLVGTGLMIRTVYALSQVRLEFNPAHISYLMLATPVGRYDSGLQKKLLIRPVLEHVRSIPGVFAAGQTTSWPPGSGLAGEEEVTVQGRPGAERWALATTMVSEDYPKALALQMIAGRWLTELEADTARPSVVINDTLAHQHFPNQNPLGQKIHVAGFDGLPRAPPNVYFEVIGVVSDAKNAGLREPPVSQFFIPYTFTGVVMDRTILVKSNLGLSSLLKTVQKQIWTVDPDVGLREYGTLESEVQGSYFESRFVLVCLAAFAATVLLLVLAGVFAVLAYNVSLQTQEFDIRMALGSQQSDILQMVLVKGLSLIGLGIMIGILASFPPTRFLSSQLWGVVPTDPWTFTGVAALLTLSGLAACILPARRASRVDPMVALRYE